MSCNIDKEQLRMHVLELDDQDMADRIESHARSCPDCRKTLVHLRQTADILSKAFDEDVPDWLMQKTVARIGERKQRSYFWSTWGVPALAGIAIVLLILTINPVIRHYNRPLLPAVPLTRSTERGNDAFGQHKENDYLSSLFGIVASDADIDMINPVDDRSIYESLDVAPEVAPLLL